MGGQLPYRQVWRHAGLFRDIATNKGMSEALCVVDGAFTNEGKQYEAGTSLHFEAGNVHGPQATKGGCKLLILWTELTSHE